MGDVSLLERPVQVVSGKGGVGRSTVAAALALRSARAGHRTLVLEVDAPDSVTRLLGAPPAPDRPREIEPNLWACRMTPSGALEEYAQLVLRVKLVYKLVFENNLVRYLLRFIPSLAEVTMLGKMWWHATQDEIRKGEPRFERIILDAPATGHSITFLSVARTVADVSPAGILKEQAEKMAQMVESSVMHVVALPEEMPVNEGLELFGAIPSRLRIEPGLAIVNRRSPSLLEEGESEQLGALEGRDGVGAYVRAARRRLDREGLEAEHAGRFFEGAPGRGLILFESSESGRALVEAVADALEAELGS